jgi:hypothetical protein
LDGGEVILAVAAGEILGASGRVAPAGRLTGVKQL